MQDRLGCVADGCALKMAAVILQSRVFFLQCDLDTPPIERCGLCLLLDMETL